ncbi:hypothetical protein G6Y98_07405 [Clostridium perfringens]|uniref:ADP-ribosyltransferase n=1 Tax=Clostridium perfringens TaxID=1502 RepID=UPI0013E3B653|nr:ADP-ribosyltransferase domain-containing protein [Clostridium perfringens]NGT95623.1 hypothetical protein [Clostridium perfringens]
MSRDRMSKQPVGIPLTYSDYIGMVFEEPIILHSTAQRLNFQHWAEHIYSFFGTLSNEPPQYSCKERLDILIDKIVNGLKIEGFHTQSEEITNVKTQDELNKTIIKQYTEETNLYLRVNEILRGCHNYQNENNSEDDIKKYEEPLAAWILQLNSAIRREPYYEKKSYRGATLSDYEISMYKENEIFIWASFISASKSKEACLGGNVLFEIFTESAMSLNDKRFPRDISKLSEYPNEEEVLYPLACAYRVHYIKHEGDLTVIGVATVDYN